MLEYASSLDGLGQQAGLCGHESTVGYHFLLHGNVHCMSFLLSFDSGML